MNKITLHTLSRRVIKTFPSLLLLATFCHPIFGADAKDGPAGKKIEAPSPDGRYAFRYPGNSDDEPSTYVLIDRKSGKVIKRVAESNPEMGPSARFAMSVLWKPDSEQFALTGTFWKRGSEVAVFARDGATFRKLKVPDLATEIPDKVTAGREYPHVSELNSQSAKRWRKDGSLEIEVETVLDGSDDGTIQANRMVILGFAQGGEAKILKSTTKYKTENEPPPPKLDPVFCTTHIIAGHGKGNADGPASRARFWRPAGVAADVTGNIYVADSSNATLRRTKPDGTVETVAGAVGQFDFVDGTGKAARFLSPESLALGSDGTIYLVDGPGGGLHLRKVIPQGVVTTVAKDPAWAPRGLAVDRAGVIYVCDYQNCVIRKIEGDGTISLVAGQPGEAGIVDGPAKDARFGSPCGIAAAPDGSLYVIERGLVRRIDPQGVVATLAGSPNTSTRDDGQGSAASFRSAKAIAIGGQGTLYVADSGTIRQISPSGVVRTLQTTTRERLPLSHPVALTVDPQGRILVADRGTNTVVLVELAR